MLKKFSKELEKKLAKLNHEEKLQELGKEFKRELQQDITKKDYKKLIIFP